MMMLVKLLIFQRTCEKMNVALTEWLYFLHDFDDFGQIVDISFDV